MSTIVTDLEVTQTVSSIGDTVVLVIRSQSPSHYITDKDLIDSLKAYIDYIRHSSEETEGH